MIVILGYKIVAGFFLWWYPFKWHLGQWTFDPDFGLEAI